MKYVRASVLSLVLLLVVLTPVSLAPVEAKVSADSVFPGETWEYVEKENLEAHGWSPDVLQTTTTFIRDESNTTGLVVVDRGRVVFQCGDIEELSYVASVRENFSRCCTATGWRTGPSTSKRRWRS